MHRLFDSQNNNRGGYNVGKLYYYEGSVLSIEWWESFDRFTDLFFNEIYDDDGEVWIGKKSDLTDALHCTHKCWPFNSQKWLACNFSQRYPHLIQQTGHKKTKTYQVEVVNSSSNKFSLLIYKEIGSS